jgi:hypothetical protein
MKTKHTKGNWRAEDCSTSMTKWTNVYTNSVETTNIVDPIFQIKHNEELRSESEANAKLIEASPRLLEACEMSLIHLEYLGIEKGVQEYLREAIKKATE